MKLYRFELAFMGEMQNVGFLHGLNDIGLDAETERQMLAPFDKLPRKFLGNSANVSFWFTVDGLHRYLPAIQMLEKEIEPDGWNLLYATMERFKKAANIQRGAKYKGGLDKLPAKPGDYVVEAVVDEAINCLPPAFLSSACAQMGCPYSHREDPKTGRWRATYATFKRCPDVPGIWEYCGHCFQGETVERGQDPICC